MGGSLGGNWGNPLTNQRGCFHPRFTMKPVSSQSQGMEMKGLQRQPDVSFKDLISWFNMVQRYSTEFNCIFFMFRSTLPPLVAKETCFLYVDEFSMSIIFHPPITKSRRLKKCEPPRANAPWGTPKSEEPGLFTLRKNQVI